MDQTESTRRRLLTRAMTAGMGAALAACGGGGGGAGGWAVPPLPGPGDGGAGGDGGGGGTGGRFSSEQRSEATWRVAEKYEQLLGARTGRPFEALRDWVLLQPEYDAVDIDTDSLWARFTDGRYFLFTDDWKTGAPTAPMAPREGDLAARQQRAAPLAAGDMQVPGSDKALLLKLKEDIFSPEGDAAIAKAKAALEKRGWTVPAQHVLTLKALKNAGEVGLLYLNGHAAVYGPKEGADAYRDFAMLTENNSSDDADELYAQDLDDRSIILHRDRSRWNEYLYGQRRPNYAITSIFIRKYLKLAPNSLVVLMACSAGLAEAAVFRASLSNVGASEIIAWQGSATAAGYRTVDALFDRMTGVNANDPRTPPNRAFDFEDVWRYLGSRGLLENPPTGEPGSRPAPIKRFGQGGFDLTNPLITMLEVDWKDKLVVHGGFGAEPGTVSVGGTVLPVTRWSEAEIELTLPTGPNDPPGSHGDVIVTTRKRSSNVRPLTSWRGEIVYLAEELAQEHGQGRLTRELRLELHLRGDGHATRTEVDGAPKPNTWNLIAASDSRARHVSGGSIKYGVLGGNTTTSQQGRGELRIVGPAEAAGGPGLMVVIGRVDAVTRQLQILPLVSVGDYYDVFLDGEHSNVGRILMEVQGLGFWDPKGSAHSHLPLMFGTTLPMGANGAIAAYERTIVTDTSLEGRPVMQQTVRTAGLSATPALRGDVGL